LNSCGAWNIKRGGAKEISAFGGNGTARYSAVSLSLQAGWNLVQQDENATADASGNTTAQLTLKIADKNIPWVLDVDDGESGGSE
jgi:hypothetical protein